MPICIVSMQKIYYCTIALALAHDDDVIFAVAQGKFTILVLLDYSFNSINHEVFDDQDFSSSTYLFNTRQVLKGGSFFTI